MRIFRRSWRDQVANVPPIPEVPERADEIDQLQRQFAHAQVKAWRSILRTVEVVEENHLAQAFREAYRL